MKQNKLLQKQLLKFLPPEFHDDENLADFINAVNDSYNAYERDHELATRAFKLSEEDYEEVNKKLKSEVELKKISIIKLKEAISNLEKDAIFTLNTSDDLPDVIEYLKKQIEKRKAVEAALNNALELAEHSSRAKEIFLANMSHEIRTPMNAILGMSNQLTRTKLDTKQRFYLDTIQTASENLLVILNDILDLSKIEAGKLYLENIGFEPSSVVKRVMQVFMHKAEEKGLKIINSESDPNIAPVLIGDPYRLNQILLNLVSNSIKFTEKGYIDISCYVVEDCEKSQILEITVRDTGIGMDNEFKNNLFQKFVQEDKSVARKYGGTGLGMAICKNLIELMHGAIQVESQKNVGTAITLRIRFIKGTEQDLPKKAEAKIDSSILKNKKILLVEDNEMNRLVATMILNTYGAKLIEAHNGLEAIEALTQDSFDLVLMDVQMPVMDGLEATKTIREKLKLSIPIVALTANALKGENDKCFEAGMDAYLSKPFIEEELVTTISELLGIPRTLEKKSILEREEEKFEKVLYDLQYLHELCGKNEEFVWSMVDAFIKEAELAIKQIQNALKASDAKEIKSLAHRLKSNLAMLNAHILRDLAQKLENDLENNDLTEKVIKNIYQFQKGLEKILEQLHINRLVNTPQ